MITFNPLSGSYAPAPGSDGAPAAAAATPPDVALASDAVSRAMLVEGDRTELIDDESSGEAAVPSGSSLSSPPFTSTEKPKALAYILEIDDVRILLDCGAPDVFEFDGAVFEQAKLDGVDVGKGKGKAVDESGMQAVEESETSKAATKVQAITRPLHEVLRELAPSIDLVLLSHASLSHLGFFPYAHARLGLRCPVYATLPVQALGRIAVLESMEGWRREIDVDAKEQRLQPAGAPSGTEASSAVKTEEEEDGGHGLGRFVVSTKEIHAAFDDITTLRYSQPTHLEGKCAGLTLTAYSSGHTLGGTVWKIRSPSSGTILYAVDWNHNRERHLDGTAILRSSSGPSSTIGAGGGPLGPAAGGGTILEAVRRPDLLITDVERALVLNARRKDRDAALLGLVSSTLQSGHSLLLPIDPSTRLLELLVLLDQHWSFSFTSNDHRSSHSQARYPLCLVSRTGKELITYARSLMEWFGGAVAREENAALEGNTGGGAGSKRKRDRGPVFASPLEFRHLKIFPTIEALDEAIPANRPKLILAVPPTLSHGPSRRLLLRFAQSPNDVVVLTSRAEAGSLGRWLFAKWNERQEEAEKWGKGKVGKTVKLDETVRLEMRSKVPLQDAELEAFLEAERHAKEREAAERARLARSRRMMEADEGEDDDSDESDSETEANEVEGALPSGQRDQVMLEPGGGGSGRKRGFGAGNMDEVVRGGGVGSADGAPGDGPQLSFDIYLKGNASHTTSFFKSASGGTMTRFRMFPFVERKRRVDAYGEQIDVARWLSKGREMEEERDDEEGREKRRRKEEEEKKKPPPEPPSKYVAETVQVQVACQLAYIDMEGLNDGRAVKTIVPQINPRRMILVNGSSRAVQDIFTAFSAISAMTREVYAPALERPIRIGELTNSFAITLGDGLLAGLRWSSFEDYEVSHILGRVRFSAESTVPTLELSASGSSLLSSDAEGPSDRHQSATPPVDASADGVTQVAGQGGIGAGSTPTPTPTPAPADVGRTPSAPQASSSVSVVPRSLFIGDLKLPSLRQSLSTSGVPAEFAGEGMLVCGAAATMAGEGEGQETETEAVTVKKDGKGRVVIEGNLGQSYFDVRKAVYAAHAQVFMGGS